MEYLHFEINSVNVSKLPGKPCGDVSVTDRSKGITVHILADGLGSGTKANIAATMCSSRLKELIIRGMSLKRAFSNIVKTMEHARINDLPYSVFSVARILHDGTTSVFGYEMPAPILISGRNASVVKRSVENFNDAIIGESNFNLRKGDALLMVTDGVTQSGLGKGITNGWEIDGVAEYVTRLLNEGYKKQDLIPLIIEKAKNNWKNKLEDDCSVSLCFSRKGNVVNIFTGAPSDSKNDSDVVNEFKQMHGLKIVCGATTAKIVARELDCHLQINENFSSNIAPPDYHIDGIDLVTEGAVTLNQLYNVWDIDSKFLEKFSPVTELYHLVKIADKINLFVGQSFNPASKDISFVQTGTLIRSKIVELLVQKFRGEDKLVELNYY